MHAHAVFRSADVFAGIHKLHFVVQMSLQACTCCNSGADASTGLQYRARAFIGICALCRALLKEYIPGAGHARAGCSDLPHAVVSLDGRAVYGGLQSSKRRGNPTLRGFTVLYRVCRPECHHLGSCCGKYPVSCKKYSCAATSYTLTVFTIPHTVSYQSCQRCSGLRFL